MSNYFFCQDWMIANPDGSEHRKNDQTQGQTLGQVSSAEDTSNTQAKSFNCNECGKQLASADTVQLHAARTGHSDFSESAEEKKPLTGIHLIFYTNSGLTLIICQQKKKRRRSWSN